MIIPYVGLRFYYGAFNPSVLCEVVEIRDAEIVRYEPVDTDGWVGEVHVNFFDRIVKSL